MIHNFLKCDGRYGDRPVLLHPRSATHLFHAVVIHVFSFVRPQVKDGTLRIEVGIVTNRLQILAAKSSRRNFGRAGVNHGHTQQGSWHSCAKTAEIRRIQPGSEIKLAWGARLSLWRAK